MAFFTDRRDIAIQNELMLQAPGMYVSKILFQGKGVAAVTGDVVTLTPDVSEGWVVDSLISTETVNVYVKDKDGNPVEGLISSNTADAILFDAAASRNPYDIDDTPESPAASAGTQFVVGDTYDFYALTPGTVYAYGDYFGVVKELTMPYEEEMAVLEDPIDGIIAKGLIKISMTITGLNYNVTNGDVLKAVRNMVEVGSQTTYTQLAGGMRPDPRPRYRVAYLGKTEVNKDFEMIYFTGEFNAEGELAPTGTEYISLGWNFTPYPDRLRPGTKNAYRITIQK